MPLIIFTPIFNVLGMAMFMVPWVFYILFVASDGVWIKAKYHVPFGLTFIDVPYQYWQISKNVEHRCIGLLHLIHVFTVV